MSNPYKLFERLLPKRPLQIGDVVQIDAAGALVQLPGGQHLRARGEASVGQRVFVRDGLIEGPAPSLPLMHLEV